MNIIEKSINDNRTYKWIELNNKLKVIIITDDNNTNCGALLNIHVGSIHDTIPGMAHFLEHMVFMGSKKYPDVTNFFDNVSKYGGVTNAMTSDTDTTYYFTVDDKYFLTILDMFADFFIDPLLRKDYIDKEINAIDSESTKNLLSESWILLSMIQKCLFDDHPINHYTCGTKETLNVKDNDVLMHQFFDKYYSSNLMNLILFVNNKISENTLIDFLQNTFNNIKNKNVKLNEKYGQMLKTNYLLEYIPNQDIDVLIICTELPVLHTNLSDNPIDFLFWILSNKTTNSLYDILKKLNYISDIICDTVFNYNDFMLCTVQFTLTKKGYTNIEDIIQIYFEYIQSIRKSKNLELIYNDLLKFHKYFYKFPRNSNITDTMMNINYILNNNIEPSNLFNYLINLKSFDNIKSIIDEIFGNIKLYNSAFIVGSHENKLKKYDIDEIYKIKYHCKSLNPIKINRSNYDIISSNKYIDNNVDLIVDTDSKFPEKIDKIYNLFYNFNKSFNNPDVNIYILIDLNKIYNEPKSYLYFMLYLNTMIKDNTNITYMLKEAGYNLNFNLDNESLYIYIHGNNKNIDIIIDDFKYMLNNCDGKSFNMIYENMKKSLSNFKKLPVMHKISELINKKLNKKYISSYDMLKYIKNKIDFNDCKNLFFDILKSSNILSILISGNINKLNAEQIADKIYDILNIKNNLSITKFLKNAFNSNLRHVPTPYIREYYNANDNDKNCVFTVIYKLFTVIKNKDKNYAENIIFLMLLDAITNTQYFNLFRTKKQYGYVVYTKISYLGNKNVKNGCIKFLIQSPFKNSKDLYTETQNYIKNDLLQFIKNLGEEGIQEYKDGLLSDLSNKFVNLTELDLYLCLQIFDYSYDFNYKENLITALQNMSFDKFIDMFNKLIINNNNIYSISINPRNIDKSDNTIHKYF
jgi:insulysin